MASQESSTPSASRGTKRKSIQRYSSRPTDLEPAISNTGPSMGDAEELDDDQIDEILAAEVPDVEEDEDVEDPDFIISDPEKGDNEDTQPSNNQEDTDNLSSPPSSRPNIPTSFLDPATVQGVGRPEDLRRLVEDELARYEIDDHKRIDNKWIQYQLLYLGGEPVFTPLACTSAVERLAYYQSLQGNMKIKAKHEERLEDLEDEADMREKGYSEEVIRGDSEELTTSTEGYTTIHPVTEIPAVGITFGTAEILENILSKLPAREVLRFEQVTWLTRHLIKESRKLQVKLFFQAAHPTLTLELPHHTKDSSGNIQSKKRLLARKLNNVPPKIKLGGRGKHGGGLLDEREASPESDDVVLTINPLFFNTKGKLLMNFVLSTETTDSGERYILQFRTKTPLSDWLRPAANTSSKNALITDPPLRFITAFIAGFSATNPNHGKRSKKSVTPGGDDEEADDQGEEEAPVKKGKGKAKATTTDEIVPGTKKTTFTSSVQIMAEEGITLSAVLAKALECVAKWENDGARAGQEIVYDLYFPVGVEVVNDSF